MVFLRLGHFGHFQVINSIVLESILLIFNYMCWVQFQEISSVVLIRNCILPICSYFQASINELSSIPNSENPVCHVVNDENACARKCILGNLERFLSRCAVYWLTYSVDINVLGMIRWHPAINQPYWAHKAANDVKQWNVWMSRQSGSLF